MSQTLPIIGSIGILKTAGFVVDHIALASSEIDESYPDWKRPRTSGEQLAPKTGIDERYHLLQAMVDHIPDFIYAKDLDGRFLFANKAILENNGLGDVGELIGKTDFDFLPQDAAQGVMDIERRVAETGLADLGFEERAELGDTDRWLMMSRVPLRDKANRIVGVVGASRDITIRKSAERLMKAQSHLLEVIARGKHLPAFLDELVAMLGGLKEGIYAAVLLTSESDQALRLASAHGLNAGYHQLANGAELGPCLRTARDLDHKAAALAKIFAEAHIASRDYACRCIPIEGSAGELEGLLVLHLPAGTDVSDLAEFLPIAVNMTGIAIARHRAEAKIGFLAQHDALTGLANRTLFDRQLENAVTSAIDQDSGLALAFLDLDDFKLINDSLGHAAGDALLKIVAGRITEVIAECGSVARIGGDEFVIILSHADAEANRQCLSLVRRAVAAPMILAAVKVSVTCSIGLASYPAHGASAADLLVSADMAMYRAKQMGRNCVEMFDPAMAAVTRRRLSRTEELRQALARDEFVLHFQPQQDRRTGKIVGAEALIRWNHPTEGLVYPGDFIPLAEETGLIVEIGEWVARAACRIGKGWQDQGLDPIRISINVSARQFQEKSLVGTIEAAITDAGLDACWLEIEVTESLIMRDLKDSIAKMKELTELGASLAVDDFGTGYSSLSVLKKFPLSRLKIDRSFITDIPNDQDDMAITSAIISLAHNLGLEVIAEGVETEEQARFLVENGCVEIQGYLFSRPVAENTIGAMLKPSVTLV